jgi:hypothetical protein
MSFIRPEARAALWRLREVIAAGGLAVSGLWLIALGGYLLIAIGGGMVVLSIALGLLGLRRLRFAQSGAAPGVVEVDEGQISYFGPAFGGAVSVPELTELRLITAGGRRLWRLRQKDGQALLIPVEALGAERLFDAFASLPGLDTQSLVEALSPKPAAPAQGVRLVSAAPDSVVIWQRKAHVVLT